MTGIQTLRRLTDDGYVLVYRHGHPLARSHGYVLEHRLVAYEAGLITVDDPRRVHHRNHDRTDNRLENLEPMTNAEHLALHGQDQRKVDDEEARRLYLSGHGMQMVASILGVSMSAVDHSLDRTKTPRRRQGRPTLLDAPEIRRRLAIGETPTAIARALGCSRGGVERVRDRS